jgi:hypothetical protein
MGVVMLVNSAFDVRIDSKMSRLQQKRGKDLSVISSLKYSRGVVHASVTEETPDSNGSGRSNSNVNEKRNTKSNERRNSGPVNKPNSKVSANSKPSCNNKPIARCGRQLHTNPDRKPRPNCDVEPKCESAEPPGWQWRDNRDLGRWVSLPIPFKTYARCAISSNIFSVFEGNHSRILIAVRLNER